MSLTSYDDYINATKPALETFVALSNTFINNAERITTLNFEAARTAFEKQVETTRIVLASKNIQEALAAQSSLSKPSLENAVAYSRSLYEINAGSQNELQKLAESGYEQFSKTLNTLIDQASRAAPVGGDTTFVAIKSALQAANSAIGAVSKATRQVTDIAEASVSAATNATVKAVNAVAPIPASKKKAA